MFYHWKCAFGHITETERKLADIDVPPEICSTCESFQFIERVPAPRPKNVKGFILIDSGSGWSHHGFYNKPTARSA